MRRFLTVAACLFLWCGCMQSKNPDGYAYVLNVGVEMGSSLPYLVTALVSVPGGTEDTKVENTVISAEARSFSEAYETMNAAYPGRLNFSRASLLAIGADLAASGGQSAFLDFAFGKTDLWSNLRVVVVKQPIREVFEGWITESDPSLRKIKTAAGDLAAEAGIVPDTGYSTYLEAVQDTRFDAMLAYAGTNEYGLEPDAVGGETYPYVGGSLLLESPLKTSIAGCAIFSGDRMTGILDGRHTMETLMVTDAFRKGELTFGLSDGQTVSIRVSRLRAPEMQLKNGEASVRIFLEAELLEPYQTGWSRAAIRTEIENALAGELTDVFEALRRCGSDAMGFGKLRAMQFKSASDWEACDWKAEYATLQATFRVSVMLSDGD